MAFFWYFCDMQVLNFPIYDFRLRKKNNKTYIFDIVRKKFFLLTPEEWVRQHSLHYLIIEKGYPLSLIAVEKHLYINGQLRRFDIVVFNRKMLPRILVECKAPEVPLTQTVFDQANQYNYLLKAPYLFLTNGRKHIYCQVDFNNNTYRFLAQIPKNTGT